LKDTGEKRSQGSVQLLPSSGDIIPSGGNARPLGVVFILLVDLGKQEFTLEVLSEECSYSHILD